MLSIMRKLVVPFLFALLPSCASVSVSDTICKEDNVNFLDTQLSGVAGSYTFSTAFNISNQLRQFDKYGTISVYLSKDEITSLAGDLSWMASLRIDLQKSDGTIMLLTDTALTSDTTVIDIPIDQNINLYAPLDSGEVSLLYTVSGVVPSSFQITNQICFDVSAKTEKTR